MINSWMLHPSQGFIRLGGHQLVQASVAGETVLEGDDVPGAADEAAARRHIGQAYPKSEEKAITKTNNLSAKAGATNVTNNNGYVGGLIRHP